MEIILKKIFNRLTGIALQYVLSLDLIFGVQSNNNMDRVHNTIPRKVINTNNDFINL